MSLKNGDHFGEKPMGYRNENGSQPILLKDRLVTNEDWDRIRDLVAYADEHLILSANTENNTRLPKRYWGEIISFSEDTGIAISLKYDNDRIIEVPWDNLINIMGFYNPEHFGY